MPRDPAESAALRKESGLGQPYVDPRLRCRLREYAGVLIRFHQAGMLEWEVADRVAAFSTGVFFVEKANGVHLRLVFDTRVANLSFAALLLRDCRLRRRGVRSRPAVFFSRLWATSSARSTI